MAVVAQVRLDTTDIRALVQKMDSRRAGKAIARGLTDAIKQGRTVARKSVRDRYNIPLAEFTKTGKSSLLRLKSARTGDLSASLFANVKRSLKLGKFKGTTGDDAKIVTSKRTGTYLRRGKGMSSVLKYRNSRGNRKKVSVEIIKGQRKTMDNAFIVRMKSGHVGVFGRSFNSYGYGRGGGFQWRNKRIGRSKNDTPIAELGSMSLHKAIANRANERQIIRKMEDALPRRVRFWLQRELKIV